MTVATITPREYAKTNGVILVMFGLGVQVFYPTRSPGLHMQESVFTELGILYVYHCLDCDPTKTYKEWAYLEHLNEHTGRKKRYPVVVSADAPR